MKPKALPSVRRGPPADARHPASDHDPVDLCLSLWKEWMQQCDRDLGAKTMRGLAGDGDGFGDSSPWDAQRANDMIMAAATNAVINSLSSKHSWAIHRACSIASVWMFPQLNFMEVLTDARIELEKKLRKNICTAVLFG